MLRLFCSSDRTNDEIEALFVRVITSQNSGGLHIRRAIETSLRMAQKPLQRAEPEKIHKDGNMVMGLANRYRGILLELRLQGYGYGKIAMILARRKVYNKKTNKAYSRHTIKNALIVLREEKNGND